MWSSPAVSAIAWVVAVAVTVWILVPSVAFAFGVGGVRSDVDPDPRRAEPRGDDPEYQRRFWELYALGFRAAGTSVESARFLSPLHWRWRQHGEARHLVADGGRMFVALHRLVADEPLRLSIVTACEGGRLVRTACPGVGVELPTQERHRYLSLRGVGPAELVARHREQVDAFCRDQGVAPTAATLQEIAAAEIAADVPAGRKMVAALYGLPLGLFVFPVAMLIPLMVRLGRLPLAPLAICTMGAFYALSRWLFLGPIHRHTARQSHTESPDGRAPGVTEDGRIVDGGKYERWLRALAALAVPLTGAWTVALAGHLPQLMRQSEGVVAQSLMIAFSLYIVVLHAGRARGRVLFRARGRTEPGAWWLWGMLNLILHGSLWHGPSRALNVVAVASIGLAGLGWLLERRRTSLARAAAAPAPGADPR